MKTQSGLENRRSLNARGSSAAKLALALLIGLAAFLPAGAALADDARAREIMQKVNDRDDGDRQVADMEMILIDSRGKKRVRKLRSFRRDKGPDTLSIMFFRAPADVRGTGFLTYDYDDPGKDDDQWLYLPALRKTKRIASNNKSGSFMGSDFNYSDMTARDLEDFDFTLMKEVKVGGVKTWQIKSVPRSEEVAEESGYAKSISWVRQDNFVVVRAVMWVHKSRRRKFFQVKKLEKIDGIWVATHLQIATRQGKRTVHTTVLRFSGVRFNQKMNDDLFSVRSLEKGL